MIQEPTLASCLKPHLISTAAEAEQAWTNLSAPAGGARAAQGSIGGQGHGRLLALANCHTLTSWGKTPYGMWGRGVPESQGAWAGG